jgi:ribonuclease E
MSEHPLSGGHGLPSPNPGRRRGSASGSPADPSLRPVLSQPRSEASPPAASGGSAAPDTADSSTGAPRKRRGRRGGRRRRSSKASATGSESETAETAEATSGTTESEGGTKKKRSRRRGGRGRRASSSGEAAPDEAPAREEPAGEGDDESKRKRRPRRLRSHRSKSPEENEAEDSGEGSAGAKTRSRKRGSRGGRGRKKAASAVEIEFIPGEEDDLPELNELPEDAVLIESSSKRSRKTKDKTKAKKRTKRARKDSMADVEAPAAPPKKRIILVNAVDPEETRVVVVEGGRIVDLQMTVKKHTSYVSDIYRGRVVNIESAIGAAFVDFGQGRNGFLHASDILSSYGDPDWSLERLLSTPVEAEDVDEDSSDEEAESAEVEEEKPEKKESGRSRRKGRRSRPARVRIPIDKLVKKGQMVAVQITKDAIGDKGPTLTTYVSIPGRYLVLMPSLERTGVSRKIDDEKERRRLKRILSALEIPDGMGVIVRTAGIGKTKAELKRDLDYLLLAWEDFSKRLKSGRNPAPLYQESDVAIRTMRDLFTSETASVIVDDDEVFDRMVDFTKILMPEHVERIKRHDGPRPLLQTYGVEQDFEKIFARRVELPSGGSIVLDQTEALVAIDVNSGRTREAGAEFEDIALKTNLEAAPEIARQIRLRDLGGIIVLDYIDMMRANGRRAVERATREALKSDRARSKIGRISQFGLLELTRQRLGPGLSKLVYDTCQRCRGSGRRRNASSRAQAILRRLAASLALKGFTTVEVRAHPEVIEYLEKELQADLAALEETSGRKLVLMSVPDQTEDSVLHYLRADGREVRPGGRRKR